MSISTIATAAMMPPVLLFPQPLSRNLGMHLRQHPDMRCARHHAVCFAIPSALPQVVGESTWTGSAKEGFTNHELYKYPKANPEITPSTSTRHGTTAPNTTRPSKISFDFTNPPDASRPRNGNDPRSATKGDTPCRPYYDHTNSPITAGLHHATHRSSPARFP